MTVSSMQVALASDGNYIDGLAGTLIGVARHAPQTRIEVLIMDCGISPSDLTDLNDCVRRNFANLELTIVPIRNDTLAQFNPTDRKNRLNNTAYARLLLARLMPQWDRVLYLDCDLVVDTDLTPLYETPLDGAPIGAVPEEHLRTLGETLPDGFIPPDQTSLPVFNSGVMVMDLSALRHSSLIDEIMAQAGDTQSKLQDQALLNRALIGRWKELPARWNRQRFVTENFSIYRTHPDSVWHFIGKMKPWHFAPGHGRGLVADFQHHWRAIGWRPRFRGEWRPRSPAWRDSLKRVRAFMLRRRRTLAP